MTLALPPGWRPLRSWVLLLTLAGILNIVAYVAMTRPLWFEVTAQSRALEASRQARQLLEPALEQARADYGLVLQAENDIQELHSRIAASASNVSSVIESLRERLQAVGMRFDRSSYAQERIDELDLILLQMAVPLAGRYSAVRELVESLAVGEGFMAIDQVGLVSPEEAGPGASLQVELQLAAFLPASDEEAQPEAGGGTEMQTTEQAAPRRDRPASDVSPVQRAEELQEQLASLPPLPFPPDSYDVRIDDLDVPRKVSEATGRNLFDYVRPPAPAVPPQPRPGAQAGGAGGGGRQGAGAQPGRATASRPSIPLRLLGIVRVGAVRYASLTDGTELHVAAEGSSLPGGYLIVEVGIDYAEIKLGEQQVRLTLES
jgi:hypothetical protein